MTRTAALKPTDPWWQAIYCAAVQVVLRRLEPADAIALEAVLCDPEVMRYGYLRTPEDCITFVEAALESYEQYDLGPFAVCDAADPTLVGYCALRRGLEWQSNDEVELGYRLIRSAWGQGIGTAAASLARDLAFERHRAARLSAAIDPGNVASIRVAERIGMRQDGEIMFPEYDHPDLRFTMSANDWQSLSH